VFDAATAPAEACHPDPTDRAVPPRVGSVLGLVRTFIAYGSNLADTLAQHAANPRLLLWFAFVARIFATTDVAQIRARISRGLLRAAALEKRLCRRAARGQELKTDPTRLSRARKPGAAKPATRPDHSAASPTLAGEPALEQILAQDRRRPIGAVLVDICRDLGIVLGQLDYATGKELHRAVILYGGSLDRLVFRRGQWQFSEDPAECSDVPIPLDSAGQPIIAYPPWPAPPEKQEKPPSPCGRIEPRSGSIPERTRPISHHSASHTQHAPGRPKASPAVVIPRRSR